VSLTAVVAFGGNALVTDAAHDSIPEQYDTVCRTVPHLADMIEQGWRLVVSYVGAPTRSRPSSRALQGRAS
jgi:carbamate kinase